MVLVSLAMFSGYLFTEVLSPLKSYVETTLGWSPADFGAVTGGYGFFNVFLGALIIVGILLDKFGVRKSAIISAVVMIVGAGIKYYALTPTLINGGFGYEFGEILAGPLGALLNFFNRLLSFGSPFVPIKMNAPVALTLFGYAIFGVGVEYAGITASKAIVKWFKGKEMALAMGLQVALARLGSFTALFAAPFIVESFKITTPFAIGILLLIIGLISFILYNLMDAKLDKQDSSLNTDSEEDKFTLKDIKSIVTNRGFWYITILCVLFYSAVFPFYKFGPDLMVNKFGVSPKWAGLVPSLVPLGTIILTPLFGRIYDKKGKGASIMILGSMMLIGVHVILFLPFVTNVFIAALDVIIEKQLGTAFALIFYIQNWGLTFVPIMLGIVLRNTNPDVVAQLASLREKFAAQGLNAAQIAVKIEELKSAGQVLLYNYSTTWLIFIVLTVLSLLFAFLLKAEDKRKNYGLEQPNIQE
jgi:nitrate/nitrite transporter NarK